MVRISKYQLPEKVLIRIYQLFFEVFTRSKSNEKFFSLIEDILSPSEKIMIAKRIAIIYLLVKGLDMRSIAKSVKTSTSTVLIYSRLFHNKQTQLISVINEMLQKEKVLGFIEDVFADLLIQPGIKISHHKLKYEHEKRRKERKVLG